MSVQPRRIIPLNGWRDQRKVAELDAPAITRTVEVSFSRREIDIIRGLSEGFQCKQIAARVLLPKTRFCFALAGLRSRAGVQSNAELVAWAIRNGII